MFDQNIICDDIDRTQLVNTHFLENIDKYNTLFGNSITKLSILSQNIRSIRKNLDNFLILLSQLKPTPDIIILTECWLDTSFTPININNYNCHYSVNYLNQNDGIVVYYKNYLNIEILEPTFQDANCLTLNLENKTSIVAIYRSPSKYNIDGFLNSLEITLQNRKEESCIILGDINLDISETTTDKRVEDYLNLTYYYGFLCGHNYPTRGSSCLDHAMVRTKRTIYVAVLSSCITDHDAVAVSLEANSPVKFPNNIKKQVKYNNEEIKQDIENTDWSYIMKENDVNLATNMFIADVNKILNKNKIEKNIKSSLQIKMPWITTGMLKCIRVRDAMNMKLKKNPNNVQLKEEYKRYRNYCNNILQNLKDNHDKRKIMEEKGNSKRTWEAIKDICNLKPNKTHNEKLLKIKENDTQSLQFINKYYTDVGSELAHQILNMTGKSEQELVNLVTANSTKNPSSFFMNPTDEMEIMQVVSGIKSRSAPGWDKISNDVIKQNKYSLAGPISHICNLSIRDGVVPDCLKKADIIPIYKGGNMVEASNYRPISLLSTISKILEKVVNRRLTSYLEKFNLISPNQYGFRQGKSTEDALLDMVRFVTGKLDAGEKCVGVFLDLAKAFDTVSRTILIRKLEALGIRGVTLEWFCSYLNKRQQRTIVSNKASEYATTSFGVPQGSVLGPTLFLVYINCLCNLNLSQAKIFAFADDTAIIFHGKTWEATVDIAEKGLHNIKQWLNSNLLTLNVKKTNYINFRISSKSAPKISTKIKIHECQNYTNNRNNCLCPIINNTKTVKYLGVNLDEQLTWENHIQMLTNKLRKLQYILRRVGRLADTDIANIVYHSICESIISYCIVAWGGTNKTLLYKLERAQRIILKMLCNKSYRYPTDALYKNCNKLRVRQLFIVNLITKFHKTSLQTAHYASRSNRQITWKIPNHKTKFSQKFYPFLAPFLYNKIHKSLDICELKKHKCKMKLKKWFENLNYDETETILSITR